MEQEQFFEGESEPVILTDDIIWFYREKTTRPEMDSYAADGYFVHSCKEHGKDESANCLFYKKSFYDQIGQSSVVLVPPVDPEIWPIATLDGVLISAVLISILFAFTAFSIFIFFHRIKVNFKNR